MVTGKVKTALQDKGAPLEVVRADREKFGRRRFAPLSWGLNGGEGIEE